MTPTCSVGFKACLTVQAAASIVTWAPTFVSAITRTPTTVLWAPAPPRTSVIVRNVPRTVLCLMFTVLTARTQISWSVLLLLFLIVTNVSVGDAGGRRRYRADISVMDGGNMSALDSGNLSALEGGNMSVLEAGGGGGGVVAVHTTAGGGRLDRLEPGRRYHAEIRPVASEKEKKLHHDKITFSIHCKKGVSDFLPSPAGMPHTKQLFPARESLVRDIPAGDDR